MLKITQIPWTQPKTKMLQRKRLQSSRKVGVNLHKIKFSNFWKMDGDKLSQVQRMKSSSSTKKWKRSKDTLKKKSNKCKRTSPNIKELLSWRWNQKLKNKSRSSRWQTWSLKVWRRKLPKLQHINNMNNLEKISKSMSIPLIPLQ